MFCHLRESPARFAVGASIRRSFGQEKRSGASGDRETRPVALTDVQTVSTATLLPVFLCGLTRDGSARPASDEHDAKDAVACHALAVAACADPGTISCGASPGVTSSRATAIDERDHSNGMRHHAWIVRREDEGHAMPVAEVAHHVHEDLGVLAVEIRGRFVGEDQRRACGDRSCHSDPLLPPDNSLGRRSARSASPSS